MGRTQRNYEKEYKEQAVKLAKKIGTEKAARELGMPKGTLSGWLKAVREGRLDAGPGSHTPGTAMNLAEEVTVLRKQVKTLLEPFQAEAEAGQIVEVSEEVIAASKKLK